MGDKREQPGHSSQQGWNQREPSQQVKLKDSCDTCSSCKVRCTKEKPICARCRKYGRLCFYSPARRVGRPHQLPAALSIPLESPIPKNVSTYSPTAHHTASCGNAETTTETMNAGTHAGNHTVESGNHILETLFTSPQVTSACHLRELPDTISSTSTSTSHNTTRRRVSCSCAALVLHVFQDVGTLLLGQQLALEPNRPTNSSLIAATKTMSHILICPCSQRLDVALLCVAVCNVMLDIIDTWLGSFQCHASSQESCPTEVATSMNAMGNVAGDVTGYLHPVATLVVHLTRRYGDEELVDSELQDVLSGFATELKIRTQKTMHQATESPIGFSNDATPGKRPL